MSSLLRAAVVGDPVAHSLSPRLFGLWAKARGRELAYEPLKVTAAAFSETLSYARADGPWLGWNVTAPHKERAAQLADECDPSVDQPGAANVLLFVDGRVLAHNTDVQGFLDSLAAAGAPSFGIRAAVLGAGGAAAAAVAALRRAGAAEVAVYNRGAERAQALSRRFGVSAGTLSDAAAELSAFDLIVNATSAGFAETSPLRAGTAFRPDSWAVDLGYRPKETPFLAQARAGGARTLGGLGMLVRQAALTWRLFFGETLPEDAVAAALADLEAVP
ncbi:MAG: shikimate dehydrogenase [Elusimicrobia bacterium]|nr:shikimate dehydrogenase [Elusimicrobiota bacterium]